MSNYATEIETVLSPFKKERKFKSTWTRPTIEYHVRIPKVVLSLLRDERPGFAEGTNPPPPI